jgi:hypothetical protein
MDVPREAGTLQHAPARTDLNDGQPVSQQVRPGLHFSGSAISPSGP